ncbi:MAG: MMPL family transporter [Actinomycetota bacterium]
MSDAAAPHRGPFGRLAHGCARRRRWVVAAWAAVFLLLGAFAPRLADQLSPGGFEIAGSTSDGARTLLRERFTQDFPSAMTVVVTAPASRRDALDRVVADASAAIAPARFPLVGRVSPPLVIPSGDTLVALVEVGLTQGIDMALRDSSDVIDAARGAAAGPVTVEVTGGPAVFTDFNAVNEEDLKKSELIQLPLIILILVLVLGSLIAAGLPVVATVLSLATTLGALFFVAQVFDLSIYVQNVVPLVGIGVGVDYSLLIVNRFREELRRGRPPVEAAAVTGATAGRAVFFSGLTVGVALAGMLAVGVPIFTGFAVGTMAVVGMAVLAAVTLMPAVLAGIGHRIFRWNVGGRLTRRAGATPRTPPAADLGTPNFWERWARAVMRRPWPFIAASAAVLLALAAPALDMTLGSSGSTSLPADTTSSRGSATIAAARGVGAIAPNEIVVDGRGTPLRGDPSLADLAAAVAADPEVQAVSPEVKYSDDGTVAAIRAFAKHGDDTPEAQDLVGRILGDIAPSVASLRGKDVFVGGSASQNRDFTRTVSRNLPRVIGLVMLVTFLVLVVLFRSVLLPLKAVVMTLLSSLAAYGVLVMVFQYGWGDGLLGFEHLGHVTNWVPPFLFSILFGLSMDYEVFLLSRVREHRDRHGDDRAAVAWGLSRTGSIISAAALIMVVVFASFFANRLIPIKESALGLAVAIVLDATVVRLLLVPAFMRVAGRGNWWLPGPLDRVLPKLDEGELGAP